MSIRNEVYQEICEELWLKFELEIFNRLKAEEEIHGNKYARIRMEMEKWGAPAEFTKEFLTDRLDDIAKQLEEQKEAVS